MVEAGWLVKTGHARATRYQPNAGLGTASNQTASNQTASEQTAGKQWTTPPLYRASNRASGLSLGLGLDLRSRPSTALVMREPEASLSEIPLSLAAQETLRLVSRPLSQRPALTYNPKLLEDYEPNVTEYLPQATRQRLLEQGRVYAGPEENTDATAAIPAGTYARELANRLLIDLSWNSSRLEGNTYSLLETEQLLAQGLASNGKSVVDTQMILNHKVAIEFMLDNAADLRFNRFTVLNLHAMLSDNLLANPASCGALRHIPVSIGQSSFKPADTPQQIHDWFDLFLSKADAIEDPFEKALFTLVHLPYLQPFEDVNKRTARLSANIGLFAHNLCPLSFVDMPQARYVQAMLGVYELGRIDLLSDLFIWAYLRSCARYNQYLQVVSHPDPLRMTYRALIRSTVAHVVCTPLNKTQAIAYIRDQASNQVDPADQARFIEVVETQLMSLHEGNMARYGIRPAAFDAWTVGWV
jgi:fido (protein-threonine AMPylation protein)